jgi:hypothetical protein
MLEKPLNIWLNSEAGLVERALRTLKNISIAVGQTDQTDPGVIAIVAEPKAGYDRLADIDYICAVGRQTWVPLYWDAHNLYAGPLLRPGHLCFDCLFRRRLAAARQPGEFMKEWGCRERVITLPPPDTRQVIYELLCREFTRHAPNLNNSQVKFDSSDINSFSRHPVLRVPGCSKCTN